MTEKLFKLSELTSSKTVAFVKGNREINAKNVDSKEKSFKKFGGNIIPIMYVSGEKAVEEGCNLVDIDGKDIQSEKAPECFVIIDGQHRIYSALKSGFDLSKIVLFESYTDATTKELLSEANIESSKWNSTDYIKGSVLFNPNDLNIFASKLADRKFPVTTISKIICFSSALTPTKYSALMKGETIDVKYDLDRAEKFLIAASIFDDKFISKRYLIDEVINLSMKYGYQNVFQKLGEITDEEKETIKKTLNIQKSETINSILESKLSDKKITD